MENRPPRSKKRNGLAIPALATGIVGLAPFVYWQAVTLLADKVFGSPESDGGPSGLMPGSGEEMGFAFSAFAAYVLLVLIAVPCIVCAVLCGHKSLSRIAKSSGTESGRWIAAAGLIMGYFAIGLFFFALSLD